MASVLAGLGIGTAAAGTAAAGTAAAAGTTTAAAGLSGVQIAEIALSAAGLIGSGIYGSVQTKKNEDYNQAVLEQQQAQIQAQQEISAKQSERKKRLLAGQFASQAGASGLKLTGSLAQSLNQSLTSIGIDEGINKYNLGLQSSGVSAQSQISSLKSQSAMMGSAASTLMQGADFTKKYWGK